MTPLLDLLGRTLDHHVLVLEAVGDFHVHAVGQAVLDLFLHRLLAQSRPGSRPWPCRPRTSPGARERGERPSSPSPRCRRSRSSRRGGPRPWRRRCRSRRRRVWRLRRSWTWARSSSSLPSITASGSAPILIFAGRPSVSLPTSISSTVPLKSSVFMSAMTASARAGLEGGEGHHRIALVNREFEDGAAHRSADDRLDVQSLGLDPALLDERELLAGEAEAALRLLQVLLRRCPSPGWT